MLHVPFALSIDALPLLVRVEPPPLDQRQEKAVAAARDGMNPGDFDGPVMMVRSFSPRRLAVFEATYAWALAQSAGMFGDACCGQLGIAVSIDDGRGARLWQRRGAGISEPGTWQHSAQGGVDPGEGLIEGLLRETREETGLDAGDLTDLRPCLLFVEHASVTVLCTATLVGERPLQPPGPEVAELAWSARGDELEPFSPRWGVMRDLAGRLSLLA